MNARVQFIVSVSVLLWGLSSPVQAGFSEVAASAAYDAGFHSGTQPSTSELAAWKLASSGPGGSIGSSASNGGSGTVNTNGRAFVINAVAQPSRTFTSIQFSQGPLQQGQIFGVYVDAGTSSNTTQVVGLAAHPVGGGGYDLGPNLLMYGGDYEVSGSGSDWFTPNMLDSGIPTAQPIQFLITAGSGGQYTLTLNSLTSALSFSHTFSPGGSLDTFYAEVDGSTPVADPAGALIFNGLRLDSAAPALDPVVPEPTTLSLAVVGVIAALYRRPRRASSNLPQLRCVLTAA